MSVFCLNLCSGQHRGRYQSSEALLASRQPRMVLWPFGCQLAVWASLLQVPSTSGALLFWFCLIEVLLWADCSGSVSALFGYSFANLREGFPHKN